MFVGLILYCRTGVQTFRREHDRFWVAAAHPTLNLFAAGMFNTQLFLSHSTEVVGSLPQHTMEDSNSFVSLQAMIVE